MQHGPGVSRDTKIYIELSIASRAGGNGGDSCSGGEPLRGKDTQALTQGHYCPYHLL
jgi:hypothetical protein